MLSLEATELRCTPGCSRYDSFLQCTPSSFSWHSSSSRPKPFQVVFLIPVVPHPLCSITSRLLGLTSSSVALCRSRQARTDALRFTAAGCRVSASRPNANVPILYRMLDFQDFEDFGDFVESANFRRVVQTCHQCGSNPCRGATEPAPILFDLLAETEMSPSRIRTPNGQHAINFRGGWPQCPSSNSH